MMATPPWGWLARWLRLPAPPPVSSVPEKAHAAQQMRDLDRRLRLLEARVAVLRLRVEGTDAP